MKIDLTITRSGIKEQLKIEIPTGWTQVTFKQFVELTKLGSNIVKIVALFTGLDEETIRKAEIHNLDQVTACLSFLTIDIEYTIPATILGYSIPTNLDKKSIAQYSDLQGIIATFKKDDPDHNFSQFPLIVATYAIDPYDFTKAEEIKEQFWNAPCTEVLAVANFTLAKLGALNRGIAPTYPRQGTLKNRLKLALRSWLKNLAFTLRFYLWKRSLPLNERNYLNGVSKSLNSI